ncbi:hypothetical protein GUITHDRAFT_155544 [Guillardia theta CCMP2712]|uniref:AN1-type domain-containing protein n=1 Tax=Guillardia theta (strain CCMP2712) TaxID=905079 RepID=L1IGX8_GUITC|nr:hypothetical protein GUITHDRAFT_155544 [Guillardia theta CCMP2712]EKX35317.1 hypothetical protein GUITHDRAFT_155544 [Guillardia theta CCMP2712]|eukprot:XP_005822297.1 hypothetical protein GUITHDRAFT_155544 [Guillardia theta CCMP2712]
MYRGISHIVGPSMLILALTLVRVSYAISDFSSQSIELQTFASIDSNSPFLHPKNSLVAHYPENVELRNSADLVGGFEVASWTKDPEISEQQTGDDTKLRGCSRLRGGAGKRRCVVKGCKEYYMQIAGDCQYCDLKFCPDHRLPEEHACKNLCLCKEDAYNKNYMQLAEEAKAVAVRRENMIRGQPNN